ncbi:hypothetical protein F4820DRAFT_467659 [Hypoxylon rubiginosum]|uniref:Uncharacterized protein n=1 Tax=Hypoxylon rubiginosum TaxID=110542 RepID=A0ACB9YID0_9PEZI|nr:hypothetical protein F4820DRAFT_467659 [Hypoxylon rubiginosum]
MDSQSISNTGDASETKRHDTNDTSATAPDTTLQRSNSTNSQVAHIDAVPKCHSDGDMAGILEELRRVQEKLSDIDQRTRLDTDKSRPIDIALASFSEQQMIDSFLIKLREQDPPSRVALDLQKTTRDLYIESETDGNDLNSLQRHIRFDKDKMDRRHSVESQLNMFFHTELLRRYKDLLGMNKKEARNVTEDVIQPKLNHVDWISFKACGEVLEAASFMIDVLVGEPILPDSLFSPVHVYRRKPATFQDEQKPKESAISGQAPLPERIRLNSSVLLTLLSKIHGAEVSKKGGAVVMVRPFKALSFYQVQLRDWYAKLRNNFSPSTGGKESATQEVLLNPVSKVGASVTQATEVEVDNPGPDTHGIGPSLDRSTKEESKSNLDGDASQNKEDDVTMSMAAFTHLGCLLEFMDTTIVEKQKYLEEHCKKVSFVDVWHLFRPGVEVIEPGDKYMQCYRVVKVTTPKHKVIPRYFYPRSRNKGKGETTASIHCVYVDFDGRLLGPVSKRFDISRFEGQKDVTSLPVYPLSLARNKTTTKQTLVDRGERFLRVIRVGHMHYSGLTLESRDEVVTRFDPSGSPD